MRRLILVGELLSVLSINISSIGSSIDSSIESSVDSSIGSSKSIESIGSSVVSDILIDIDIINNIGLRLESRERGLNWLDILSGGLDISGLGLNISGLGGRLNGNELRLGGLHIGVFGHENRRRRLLGNLNSRRIRRLRNDIGILGLESWELLSTESETARPTEPTESTESDIRIFRNESGEGRQRHSHSSSTLLLEGLGIASIASQVAVVVVDPSITSTNGLIIQRATTLLDCLKGTFVKIGVRVGAGSQHICIASFAESLAEILVHFLSLANWIDVLSAHGIAELFLEFAGALVEDGHSGALGRTGIEVSLLISSADGVVGSGGASVGDHGVVVAGTSVGGAVKYGFVFGSGGSVRTGALSDVDDGD